MLKRAKALGSNKAASLFALNFADNIDGRIVSPLSRALLLGSGADGRWIYLSTGGRLIGLRC
jgi:hypothetical protein